MQTHGALLLVLLAPALALAEPSEETSETVTICGETVRRDAERLAIEDTTTPV